MGRWVFDCLNWLACANAKGVAQQLIQVGSKMRSEVNRKFRNPQIRQIMEAHAPDSRTITRNIRAVHPRDRYEMDAEQRVLVEDEERTRRHEDRLHAEEPETDEEDGEAPEHGREPQVGGRQRQPRGSLGENIARAGADMRRRQGRLAAGTSARSQRGGEARADPTDEHESVSSEQRSRARLELEYDEEHQEDHQAPTPSEEQGQGEASHEPRQGQTQPDAEQGTGGNFVERGALSDDEGPGNNWGRQHQGTERVRRDSAPGSMRWMTRHMDTPEQAQSQSDLRGIARQAAAEAAEAREPGAQREEEGSETRDEELHTGHEHGVQGQTSQSGWIYPGGQGPRDPTPGLDRSPSPEEESEESEDAVRTRRRTRRRERKRTVVPTAVRETERDAHTILSQMGYEEIGRLSSYALRSLLLREAEEQPDDNREGHQGVGLGFQRRSGRMSLGPGQETTQGARTHR